MGSPQPLEGALNPKSISKRKVDDNGEESVVTYGEWLVGFRFQALLIAVISFLLVCKRRFCFLDCLYTRHPSALHTFEQAMEIGKGKQIFVFLDFDGTLSPIVNDPERAFMTDEMRSALHEVAKHFPTAIVTGRSRDKAVEFVKLKDLCYAGSHGMHISIPPGLSKQQEPPEDQTQIADEQGFINFYAAKEFSQKLKKAVDKFKELVNSVIKSYPEFRMAGGNKVYPTLLLVIEVRPDIEWNKGHALGYLLGTFGFDFHSDEVLPLYIGDDLTDEDAFKYIKELGRGFPIVVSSKPKMTEASFSLRDTTEVMKFLRKLTEWRRSSS